MKCFILHGVWRGASPRSMHSIVTMGVSGVICLLLFFAPSQGFDSKLLEDGLGHISETTEDGRVYCVQYIENLLLSSTYPVSVLVASKLASD